MHSTVCPLPCDALLLASVNSQRPTPQGYLSDLPLHLKFEHWLQRLGPRPAFLLFDMPSTSIISPMPKSLTISTDLGGHTFDLHPDLSSESRPISPAASGQSPPDVSQAPPSQCVPN